MVNFNKKNLIKDSLLGFLFCLTLYLFFVAHNGKWYQFSVLMTGFVIFVIVASLLFTAILYILLKFSPRFIPCFFLSVFSGILFLRFFKSSVLFSLGLGGGFFWLAIAIIISLLLLISIFIGYKFQRKVIPFIIIFLFSITGNNFIDASNIVFKKYKIAQKIQSDYYRNDYQSFKKDANFTIRPNIYHIVLDSYANNKTLKNFYNIDNSKFYKELRKRGFKVYETAYSNGAHTLTSMNAVFNMKFSNPVQDRMSFYGKNPAWGTLFAGGYTAFCVYPCQVHSESPGQIIDKIFFIQSKKNDFFSKIELFTKTYLGFFLGIDSLNVSKISLKSQYYYSIKQMEDKNPTLFYYHDISTAHSEAAFENINSTTLMVLDDILQNDPNSIIILHSDHGNRSEWMAENSDTPSQNFGILQAVKFPKECERFNQIKMLSPVNYYQYIHSCLRGEKQPRHLEPANSYMRGLTIKNLWSDYSTKPLYMFIENGKILKKPVKIEE